MPLLEVNQLSRKYGDYTALKPATFSLEAGQVVGLSGPNGAGKSTLLLTLGGLIAPTTGTVAVDGHDLYRDEVGARRALAYVPDVPAFYHELTAWEHLLFIARAHGLEPASKGFETDSRALLDEFGLWEGRNLFPHAYSRGMRLKLGLALALIRPFKVLLLDEPTSALDVESIATLARKLLDLKAAGAAVLLTTHDPQLIQRLGAERWRMRDGELFTNGSSHPDDDAAFQQRPADSTGVPPADRRKA